MFSEGKDLKVVGQIDKKTRTDLDRSSRDVEVVRSVYSLLFVLFPERGGNNSSTGSRNRFY